MEISLVSRKRRQRAFVDFLTNTIETWLYSDKLYFAHAHRCIDRLHSFSAFLFDVRKRQVSVKVLDRAWNRPPCSSPPPSLQTVWCLESRTKLFIRVDFFSSDVRRVTKGKRRHRDMWLSSGAALTKRCLRIIWCEKCENVDDIIRRQ